MRRQDAPDQGRGRALIWRRGRRENGWGGKRDGSGGGGDGGTCARQLGLRRSGMMGPGVAPCCSLSFR
jgi:hypothetical protein